MTGATESRRRMMILARHNKPLEDSFLAEALLQLRSPRWTMEFAAKRLSAARALNNLQGGIALMFAPPAPRFDGEEAEINIVLRQSSGFGLSNGRSVATPLLDREKDKWLQVGTNEKQSNHTNQMDVDWFIEKVQNFVPAFEPEFACGDTDVLLANRLRDHPVHVAWPLVYYGPALVKEFGREKLLKAPVWEAKEDPRGGIWLEVAENPFMATKAQVNALANHLGLEKRKG